MGVRKVLVVAAILHSINKGYYKNQDIGKRNNTKNNSTNMLDNLVLLWEKVKDIDIFQSN